MPDTRQQNGRRPQAWRFLSLPLTGEQTGLRTYPSHACSVIMRKGPPKEETGAVMSRYREITVAEMDPAQKRVHDQIIAGRRGRFGGPFQLLIRAPEICEHASKLGEHLRWGTSLTDRLSELAIITTAQFWRAQYEWYAHAPLAEKAGVPAAAIEAIRRGDTPSFELKDEALVYRVCNEIFRTQRLSDTSFSEAVKAFG